MNLKVSAERRQRREHFILKMEVVHVGSLRVEATGAWKWSVGVAAGGDVGERVLFQDEADGLALSEICVLPSFCRWNGAGGPGCLDCKEL